MSQRVKMTLTCSLNISSSFARNKQFLKIMPLHTEGSWLQKFWEGLFLSSWTWIPRASLQGLHLGEGVGSPPGVGPHQQLLKLHCVLWLLGERCRNLKVGEVGLFITCALMEYYDFQTRGKVKTISPQNSGCFLRTQTFTEHIQNTLYQNHKSTMETQKLSLWS